MVNHLCFKEFSLLRNSKRDEELIKFNKQFFYFYVVMAALHFKYRSGSCNANMVTSRVER